MFIFEGVWPLTLFWDLFCHGVLGCCGGRGVVNNARTGFQLNKKRGQNAKICSQGCCWPNFGLKSLVIAQILRQSMRLHKGIYASSRQHQFSFLVMSHNSVGGCVCPLVGQFMGWSIGPSFHNGFVLAGRDEPANNYIRQQDSIASTPTSSTLIAGCIH